MISIRSYQQEEEPFRFHHHDSWLIRFRFFHPSYGIVPHWQIRQESEPFRFHLPDQSAPVDVHCGCPSLGWQTHMPVREFLHEKEQFRSRTWTRCSVHVHLLQSRHGDVLLACCHRWITSVHSEDFWAIIVSVIVGVKHRQRAEQQLHCCPEVVTTHFVAIS